MVINASDYSQDKIQQLRQEARKVYTKSNFKFIQEHRGLRAGEIHVLMGTAGSGKSTVTRSILADMLKINPDTVYAWLSEESIDDFILGLVDNNVSENDRSKLNVETELDSEKTLDEILERVEMIRPRVLLIDNITTSAFYMGKMPSEQDAIIRRLKSFAKKQGIAVLIIAHTKKGISDNHGEIITENDVRGSGGITNLAEFFYILQRFHIGESYTQTVRIQKHRSQPVKNKMFILEFSPEERTYSGDLKIDFEEFKEIFKNRNKL